MAATSKDIANVLKNIPEDKIDDAANKLGFDSEALKKFISKPTAKGQKAFGAAFLEKVGNTIEGAQEFVDQVLGRGGVEPPQVAAKFKTETTGPLPSGRGKGFSFLPGNDKPGGPLVPAGSRSLDRVRNGLVESEVVYDPVTKAPMSSETALVPLFGREEGVDFAELADLASKAKPGKAGKGISEITPDAKTKRAEGYRTEAERAVDSGIDADVTSGVAPAVKKATVTTAVVGATTVGGFETGKRGAAALLDKPLAEQPESGQVTQAAQVDKPEDLGTATDAAVSSGAVAPEQGEQIKANVEKIKTVQDLIKEIKDENKKEKKRLEWLRAVETIAHGLATAIGANALMNRNSPFAVDFSKGPQVNWEGEFDRLQKDFNTQINALLKDEELQQKQKQFEAREARRIQEREEDVALKREAMDIRAKEAGITAEERKQAKQEKLAADAVGNIEKILALDPEKDANRLVTARGALLKTARQLLGPDELNALTQQAAQNAAEKAGVTTKAVRSFQEFLGMKPEPGKKDYALSTVEFAKLLNQKLSGEEPAPQAAKAAPAPAAEDVELEAKKKRLAELLKKQAGG